MSLVASIVARARAGRGPRAVLKPRVRPFAYDPGPEHATAPVDVAPTPAPARPARILAPTSEARSPVAASRPSTEASPVRPRPRQPQGTSVAEARPPRAVVHEVNQVLTRWFATPGRAIEEAPGAPNPVEQGRTVDPEPVQAPMPPRERVHAAAPVPTRPVPSQRDDVRRPEPVAVADRIEHTTERIVEQIAARTAAERPAIPPRATPMPPRVAPVPRGPAAPRIARVPEVHIGKISVEVLPPDPPPAPSGPARTTRRARRDRSSGGGPSIPFGLGQR